MKRVLVALVALTACSLEEGPSVEAVYRQTNAIVQDTIEDAAPLLPTLPFGAPYVGECIGKYEERADEIDVSVDVWIEYETPSEGRSIVEGVERSWRERGLEVAPFASGLTVFPDDETGTRFRLDATIVPESRRIRLSAQTVCLRPASGIPPTAIPDIGRDPRDLRGPAARDGATVREAAVWTERILEITTVEAGSRARSLPSSGPAPCYQLGSVLPSPGAPRGLPDLFTADRDVVLDRETTSAALDRVRRAWQERGFDVEAGEVDGAPTVVARFGDFAFRGRIDPRGGRLFLHASTPCLPKPAG